MKYCILVLLALATFFSSCDIRFDAVPSNTDQTSGEADDSSDEGENSSGETDDSSDEGEDSSGDEDDPFELPFTITVSELLSFYEDNSGRLDTRDVTRYNLSDKTVAIQESPPVGFGSPEEYWAYVFTNREGFDSVTRLDGFVSLYEVTGSTLTDLFVMTVLTDYAMVEPSDIHYLTSFFSSESNTYFDVVEREIRENTLTSHVVLVDLLVVQTVKSTVTSKVLVDGSSVHPSDVDQFGDSWKSGATLGFFLIDVDYFEIVEAGDFLPEEVALALTIRRQHADPHISQKDLFWAACVLNGYDHLASVSDPLVPTLTHDNYAAIVDHLPKPAVVESSHSGWRTNLYGVVTDDERIGFMAHYPLGDMVDRITSAAVIHYEPGLIMSTYRAYNQ